MPVDQFLNGEFLGNSLERWLVTLAIFSGAIFAFALAKAFIVARLRKLAPITQSNWDDMLLAVLEKTQFAFLFVFSIYIAKQNLEMRPKVERILENIFFLFFFFQLGRWLSTALTFYGKRYTEDALTKDAGRATTLTALIFLGNVFVWITMVLLLLDNYGVEVKALIAGLGVGGVAIALAVQNILGDLFASLSIVLDKPFVIGDFITVGTDMGTVEHIGLKTTRVRALSGEQLIFSNSDLLQSRVRNMKRMHQRRVVFTVGVTYDTPPEKLHRIRDIIRSTIESKPKTRFERTHLANLAASSLDFETVYWMSTAEYMDFIEVHHSLLVDLITKFKAENIEFAFPSQTLYLQKSEHDGKQENPFRA